MKIYRVILSTDYEAITNKDYSYDEYLNDNFKGERMIETWPIIEVERAFSDEEELEFIESDVLKFGLEPTFTQKAIDIFSEELKENAEILPLKYDRISCFVINVTTVLDCLDEEKSDLMMMSGRVFQIEKHVFKKEISYPNIFKIKTEPRTSIYVTEAFVKKFRDNNLVGMDFILVWDSSVE